jgi:hypothetical protein
MFTYVLNFVCSCYDSDYAGFVYVLYTAYSVYFSPGLRGTLDQHAAVQCFLDRQILVI